MVITSQIESWQNGGVYGLAVLFLSGALDVWIFVRTDCPISNRYAPTIARLNAVPGVKLLLVYPEPGVSQQAVDAHREAFGLRGIPAVLDAKLALVRKAGVRVTPEAVVFGDGQRVLYRGRIDDRQASLRVAQMPRKKDLEEAIGDGLAGRLLKLRVTKAVGCAVEGL